MSLQQKGPEKKNERARKGRGLEMPSFVQCTAITLHYSQGPTPQMLKHFIQADLEKGVTVTPTGASQALIESSSPGLILMALVNLHRSKVKTKSYEIGIQIGWEEGSWQRKRKIRIRCRKVMGTPSIHFWDSQITDFTLLPKMNSALWHHIKTEDVAAFLTEGDRGMTDDRQMKMTDYRYAERSKKKRERNEISMMADDRL